jgi:three-Cys-motif partner protein
MPTKGPVPWARPEHTGAKHRIYDLYLRCWFPILLSKNGYKSATYAEGFAGPGVYSGGEPGSPVIAIKALMETPELADSSRPTKFVFVDDDQRCVDRLRQELLERFPARPRTTDQMPVTLRKGTCAEALEDALDQVGAWQQPILAVLDSFGNAPVPHRLIKRLAGNPASEVIVTLGPQHFIRFVTELGESADEVFGGDPRWRQVAAMVDGQQKRRLLLTCYRSMLAKAGFRFLLDFEMVDRRGESLYLVFGTSHERGLQKMKEAVWQIDPAFGVKFRDPRDEQNETLFLVDQPQDAPLQRLLLQRLAGRGPTRVLDLRRYALFETVYREQHVIPALTALRQQGKIQAQPGPIRIAGVVSLPASTSTPGKDPTAAARPTAS